LKTTAGKPLAKKRLPVMEALVQHPGAFLKIIALRLCELLTMYIVTAFALNYSTQNLGRRASCSSLACWSAGSAA
jgi:hypothetical protein